MNQTTNPDIDRERIRSTELITLNRPEVFNAITQQAAVELGEMMRAAASDRTCRAIVLTGTGRGFCAGIDVKAVAGRDAVRVAAVHGERAPRCAAHTWCRLGNEARRCKLNER